MPEKYFPVPMLQGIIKDYHGRIIPDDKLIDGKNIVFEQGRIRRRWGYTEFAQNLTESITNIIHFELLRTSEKYLVVFTTRDSWVYHPSKGEFIYITRCYTSTDDTTTVTSSGTGERTVTCSGVNWETEWDARNIYQIKYGNDDPNGSGTWYTIKQINSTSVLILAEDGADVATEDYCIRLCWSGTADDIHSVITPYDPVEQERILIIVNGVDKNQKWTGGVNTTCEKLYSYDDRTGAVYGAEGDDPNIAKYAGFFGSKVAEHVVLLWTIDGSGNLPCNLDVSDAGETEIWNNAYYEILDTNDQLKGMLPLKNRFVIYKENSITLGGVLPNGNNTDPFDLRQNIGRGRGTVSIRTVKDFGEFHLFLSRDGVHRFDGISTVNVSGELLRTMMKEINWEYAHRSFAIHLKKDYLYVLFVPTLEETVDDIIIKAESQNPDRAYVYNYQDKTWSIWEMGKDADELLTKMTAYTTYLKDESIYWESWLTADVTLTASLSSGSSKLYIDSADASSVSVGMQVLGTYIPMGSGADKGHLVGSIAGASDTELFLANSTGMRGEALAGGTGDFDLRFAGGDSWEDLEDDGAKWEDLIMFGSSALGLLGDEDGNIYSFYYSETENDDDDGLEIPAYFTTKDYPLNDTKFTFKLLELVVGIVKQNDGNIQVEVSLDYGVSWSAPIQLSMRGDANLLERVIKYVQHGKQVRFKISSVYGALFEIESLLIGFNDMGITK